MFRVPHLLLRPPADRPAAATLPSPGARGEIVLKGKQLPPASLKSPGSRSGKSSGALHAAKNGRRLRRRQRRRGRHGELPTPRSRIELGLAARREQRREQRQEGRERRGADAPPRPPPSVPPDAEDDAGRPRRAVAPDVVLRRSARHEFAQGRGAVGPVARTTSGIYLASTRRRASTPRTSSRRRSGTRACRCVPSCLPTAPTAPTAPTLPRLTPHSPLGGADGRTQLADDAHAADAFEYRPLPDQRRRWVRPQTAGAPQPAAAGRFASADGLGGGAPAHLRRGGGAAAVNDGGALVEEASKTEEDPWEDAPSRLPERLRDGTLPVTRVRVRLLWAELLPMPGQHRHIAHSADLAKDLHPPEAPSLGHLQGEVLQPYVTVEVHGGTFSGAASTLQSVVQGSRFKSGYADNGFAPTWEGHVQCAASHPELAAALLGVPPLEVRRHGRARRRRGASAALRARRLPRGSAARPERLAPRAREAAGARRGERRAVAAERRARDVPGGRAQARATACPPRRARERRRRRGGRRRGRRRLRFQGARVVERIAGRERLRQGSAGMVRVTVSRLQGDAPALSTLLPRTRRRPGWTTRRPATSSSARERRRKRRGDRDR